MTGGFSLPPRRQERDGLTSGRSRRHCRRERDLPSNPDVKTHRFAGTKARPHRTLRRRRGHADVASPPALRLPVGGRPQRYERYALDCPGVAHLAVLFLEEHRLAPSARCQSVSALAALPSSVVAAVKGCCTRRCRQRFGGRDGGSDFRSATRGTHAWRYRLRQPSAAFGEARRVVPAPGSLVETVMMVPTV